MSQIRASRETHLVLLQVPLNTEADGPNAALHRSVPSNRGRKVRRVPRVSDLPAAARTNDLWTRAFLPTLLRYLGTRSDPWHWQRGFALSTLQTVWAAVYGEALPFPVAIADDVLALVSRLLSLTLP